MLNSNFAQTPQDSIEPTADQEAAAALMLRAVIQAAKSDGQLDDAEQEKLMGQLGGDIDAEEAAFLRTEMATPVDVNALANEVPRGMGPQVYAMSLLAIDLDSQAEAQYLHQLAQALGMEAAVVDIGTRRGPAPEAQALYTDMSPPEPPKETSVPDNPGFEGKGRPTKRDRRQGDLSRARHLE